MKIILIMLIFSTTALAGMGTKGPNSNSSTMQSKKIPKWKNLEQFHKSLNQTQNFGPEAVRSFNTSAKYCLFDKITDDQGAAVITEMSSTANPRMIGGIEKGRSVESTKLQVLSSHKSQCEKGIKTTKSNCSGAQKNDQRFCIQMMGNLMNKRSELNVAMGGSYIQVYNYDDVKQQLEESGYGNSQGNVETALSGQGLQNQNYNTEALHTVDGCNPNSGLAVANQVNTKTGEPCNVAYETQPSIRCSSGPGEAVMPFWGRSNCPDGTREISMNSGSLRYQSNPPSIRCFARPGGAIMDFWGKSNCPSGTKQISQHTHPELYKEDVSSLNVEP